MRFINTTTKINDNLQKDNNKKEKLTKDRKIKLDKIIKSGGFKEI